jgi:LPXTG-motif cell wall-anchored protein
MSRLLRLGVPLALLLAFLIGIGNPAQAQPSNPINHVIVIYQENWSFDSLYGKFPGANGIANAGAAINQVDKNGQPLTALPQPIDTNKRPAAPDPRFPANLPVQPFDIGKYVSPDQKHGDLIHRFYQEQYQIDGGKMDKFVTWSDNGGLTMGYFDAAQMPEGRLAQQYTLADNFFHAAYGGSFLNHFWLICACTPTWPNAPANRVAQLDANGVMVKDGSVTPDGYAVNTSYTINSPHPASITDTAQLVPQQTALTIGDRLNEKGVAWAWYSGGWSDALAGHPDPLFQFHHQPFAFFQNYADGTDGRAQHLKDESEFHHAIQTNTLPAVSFVKPLGPNNEHPGYATLLQGQQHVADLVQEVQNSPLWADTAIIITYDENGGFWDHVAPPKLDQWGDGTRVPAIIISPYAKKGFVDHTQYDTTSILKFIEDRWGLAPLGTRDAAANGLSNAFDYSQQPGAQPANVPSKLPTTGGDTPLPPLALVAVALLIVLGSWMRRRARRA